MTWLVLDPSVELEVSRIYEVFGTSGGEVPVTYLFHGWLGTACIAPANEGFAELFEALRAPVSHTDLAGEFEEVAAILDPLIAGGYVHALPEPQLTEASLASARRERVERLCEVRRVPLELDLDRLEVPAARGRDLIVHARELDARCDELAQLRGCARTIDVRTARPPQSPRACALLFELGATTWIAAAGWATPDGLDELRRANAAIAIELAMPWAAVTAEAARRWIAWAHEARICALRLAPTTTIEGDAGELERVLALLAAELPGVSVAGLPDDDVIAGARHDVPDRTRVEPLLREHLRARARAILALEDMLGPMPSSEADATVIAPHEDLIASQPRLLGGARVVADLCCGAGRVSRRLARVVGPDGAVIGIDLARMLIELGRDINTAEGIANIQVRQGYAQRLPVATASVDAAVCEWSFNLLLARGLAGPTLAEMARIVRPGGRVVVMQVLSLFALSDLAAPVVLGDADRIDVAAGIDAAFDALAGELAVTHRRLWVAEDRRSGHPQRWYRRAMIPRVVDPAAELVVPHRRRAILCYTVIAERHSGG